MATGKKAKKLPSPRSSAVAGPPGAAAKPAAPKDLLTGPRRLRRGDPQSRAAEPTIEVAVSWGVADADLPKEDAFRSWVAAAVRPARRAAEVSLRVVDRVEGQALNLQYRHRDYATNVLSFPADLPPTLGIPLLGDLVLCAPVIAAEAQAQNKPLFEHWAHLVVHGTLHLLGHHHETPAEARAMEALEIQVLESIGIQDPYQAR